MALPISSGATNALEQTKKNPILILKIDGIDTLYGTSTIRRYWNIGDEGISIGDEDLFIGGTVAVGDQEELLAIESLSRSITQQIMADQGRSSTESAGITLVDIRNLASQIVSPGVMIEEIIAHPCTLYLGFEGTGYPDDYVRIFNGIVESVAARAGRIDLNLVSPDRLKQQTLYSKQEGELQGDILSGAASLTIDSTLAGVLILPIAGPDGSFDSTFKKYLRINDEIMLDTTTTDSTTRSVTRAQLGTVANAHSAGDSVETFYVLEGNAIDMALKVMLSGVNGSYLELTSTSIQTITETELNAKAILFRGVDLANDYGVVVGDYLTIPTGINARTDTVSEIVLTDDGCYVLVAGADFAGPTEGDAVEFRSKYDTLPQGLGLKPYQVDVARFEEIKDVYGGGWAMRHYLRDGMDCRDFIDQQILRAVGAFPLVRNTRISCGFHAPPLPTEELKVLGFNDIKNPSKLAVTRSISKGFYNTISIKYDEDALDEGTFLRQTVVTSIASQDRIQAGVKALEFEAPGHRIDLGGATIISELAGRLLERYAYAPEHIENVELQLRQFTAEAGDLILLNTDGLQLTDFDTGNREKTPKLYEVVKKELNIKQAEMKIELLDTSYTLDKTYCVVAPSSLIAASASASAFSIQSSFGGRYGNEEWRKWAPWVGAVIRVRNTAFSTVYYGTLATVNGNAITLSDLTGTTATPTPGFIIELAPYSYQGALVKQVYGFLSDGDTNFSDGRVPYQIFG